MAGRRVGSEDGAGRKAERSGGTSDGEIEVESSAVNGIVDVEKSGADTGADTGRFESSVVGAARNMVESGD